MSYDIIICQITISVLGKQGENDGLKSPKCFVRFNNVLVDSLAPA